MNELSENKEINEIRQPEVENYKKIKPANEWNPEEARQYWDDLFGNMGNEQLSEKANETFDERNSERTKDSEETNDSREGLTDGEKAKIREETGWSDKIIDYIESMEQYEIYKNAGLNEAEINGRKCLTKDIDMDYVDPKTGKTNRQLMTEGRSPYDSNTGEKIELHHMGQNPNGSFAELCENSEHGDGNYKVLHTSEGESWRHNPKLNIQYNYYDRPNHWKERSEA